MLHKTSGILLHTVKYSENSLIVKIYTRTFGLQSYMISGARSKKSKTKINIFQPLALVDMVVSDSGKGSIQRISEISILYPYNHIPYDIVKSSIAIFLNELLYKAIKEEHADEGMFEYIKSTLLILDLKTENCANFHIYFMVQLCRYLGFYPQGAHSSETPTFDLLEGRFISHLPHHPHFLTASQSLLLNETINAGYNTIHLLKIDRVQRKQLLESLILFYQLHIPSFGEIKSIQVLEEVIT
jgi:DNA repair protein RecO (recombination protein O)